MMLCVEEKQAAVTSSDALVSTKMQLNLFLYGGLLICHNNSLQRKEKLSWQSIFYSIANPPTRGWLCPFYRR